MLQRVSSCITAVGLKRLNDEAAPDNKRRVML